MQVGVGMWHSKQVDLVHYIHAVDSDGVEQWLDLIRLYLYHLYTLSRLLDLPIQRVPLLIATLRDLWTGGELDAVQLFDLQQGIHRAQGIGPIDMVEAVVEAGCLGSDPWHSELAKHILADQSREVALDQSGPSPRPEHEECMEHRAILIPHDLVEGVVGLSVHRIRSEEHTSELQSRPHLVCRL